MAKALFTMSFGKIVPSMKSDALDAKKGENRGYLVALRDRAGAGAAKDAGKPLNHRVAGWYFLYQSTSNESERCYRAVIGSSPSVVLFQFFPDKRTHSGLLLLVQGHGLKVTE